MMIPSTARGELSLLESPLCCCALGALGVGAAAAAAVHDEDEAGDGRKMLWERGGVAEKQKIREGL